MEMSSLLTLDAIDRAIGDFLVGLPVQRPADRKTARCVISNDLNGANRLAPRPLPNGLQAFFSKSPVAHSDVSRFAPSGQLGECGSAAYGLTAETWNAALRLLQFV